MHRVPWALSSDMVAAVLPFLVEYGPWVWKVVLGVFVGLVLGGIHWRRRNTTLAAARGALRELERSDHVVRGTLRGSDGDLAATLVANVHELFSPPADTGGSPSTSSWRAKELFLDTEQHGRVRIDGPIEVVVGSVAHVDRGGAPAETRDDHLAIAKAAASWIHRPHAAPKTTGAATLRRVRAGDAIVARGVLEAAPSQEATGYREDATQWVLRPDGDRPIHVGACAPARELPRRSIVATIVIAGVAAGVGAGVLRMLGSRWMEQCGASEIASDVDNTHACALAAATPKRQHEAMRELLWRLDREEAAPSAQRYALAMALSDRVESCSDVVDRLEVRFRYDEAIAKARSCGNKRAEHVALSRQARFAEAAELHVPASEGLAELPTVPTLIAAGEWGRAAAATDRYVAELENKPRADNDGRDQSLMHYRCVAELLRHHAGDAGAVARMRALFGQEYGRACAPMLSEVLTGDERAKLFENDDYPLFETSRVMEKLGLNMGRDRWTYLMESPESVLVQPNDFGSIRELALVWLFDLERERLLATSRNAHVLRWLAVARAFDGDLAAAHALAKEAIANQRTGERDRYTYRDLPHLPAAIDLHGSSTSAEVNFINPPGLDAELAIMLRDNWEHDFGRLLLRAGKPIDDAYFGPRDEYKAALARAVNGDGRALARQIGGRLSWWTDGDIMAVLPHVKEGRAEVIEAVRYAAKSFSANAGTLDYYPFSLAGTAIERRGLMQIAGFTEEAKRWDEMYQRIDAVLSDRKKLVALMIWAE